MNTVPLNARDIVRYRLAVGCVTTGAPDLASAARSGLQDVSPWSGLQALHARSDSVSSESWRDSSLTQVLGPRRAVYLVPQEDLAVFTLGLMPVESDRVSVIRANSDAIRRIVESSPTSQRDVLAALRHIGGVRELRWAGATGEILPVWDTTDTIIHAASSPLMDPLEARCQLAIRFFRYLGPAGVADLAWWLDTSKMEASQLVLDARDELVEVHTENGPLLATVDILEVLHASPPPMRTTDGAIICA